MDITSRKGGEIMERDIEMRKIILNEFGIAPQLNDRNIDIKFDDNEVPNSEIKNHHCRSNSVQFSLVDNDTNETIFTMGFYKPSNPRAFGTYGVYRLELIYVHSPLMRRKGIGTFYIEKLKEHMLKHGGTTISVTANPSLTIFKNDSTSSITTQDLVKYYESFGDENIKVKILS